MWALNGMTSIMVLRLGSLPEWKRKMVGMENGIDEILVLEEVI